MFVYCRDHICALVKHELMHISAPVL